MPSFRNTEVASRLLEVIDTRKKVDATTGKVSFEGGFGFLGEQNLLQDSLCFSREVPESEFPRIVWQSLVDAARSGKVSVDSFIRHAMRMESDYLSRRPNRYVMVTEVSIDRFETLPSFRINDVTISFPLQLSKNIVRHRAAIVEKARHSLHVKPPKNYRWVRASLLAKNDSGAAGKALDAVELLLGIWNLFFNLGTGFRYTFSGPRKPVNTIMLGPLHTVHIPSGVLEHKRWWYQPNYCSAVAPKHFGPRIEELRRFTDTKRRQLKKVPYGGHIERFIRLYNRALEETDWSTSFVRLWQVLEAATITSKNENHKVTARRASAVYRDYNQHGAILDQLRSLRNVLVHETDEPSTIESNLFLLKNYVENLLIFHLHEGRRFSSLKESAQILDLLVRDDLEKRLQVHRIAQRLRQNAARNAEP